MTPLELVTMAEAPFKAILYALPLEALDLISEGTTDEFQLGMARVPESVWAEFYALTYGIDPDEYLDVPESDRRGWLEFWSDLPLSVMEKLTPYQLNVYYESILDGEDRRHSLALASVSPTERPDDSKVIAAQPEVTA